MCIAAGISHLGHFIMERLPVSLQNVPPGDHDINFLGAGRDAFANFLNAQVEGRETRRKPRGDCGNRNSCPLQGVHCGRYHFVIDADCRGCQAWVTQLLQYVGMHRLARLRAEAFNPAHGVVSGKRREINAGNGT